MTIEFSDLRLNEHKFNLAKSYIRIYGSDAKVYLQSQTTNNLEKLENKHFHWNSILDLSGKIVSSFILVKIDETEFRVITNDKLIDNTLERIEKFHISEDFEVEVVPGNSILTVNSNKEGIKGRYFFEDDKISFSSNEGIQNQQIFNALKVLTGVPELGFEVEVGELVNNTFFDELSVDYTKGCYPGQETVAKIHTRRGAAYKPVLIIVDELLDITPCDITVDNRKIGKILNIYSDKDKTYLYTSINRENRIDKKKIEFCVSNISKPLEGIVHYYPYLTPYKKDLAQDVYDSAVSYFHNGDNENAIKMFEKSIAINPNFEDAYESLGVLYGRLENFDKAIELMEELKGINEKSMMAYTNLSLYHMKLGNIDIAEKYKSDATILNFEKLGNEAQVKREQKEVEDRKIAELAKRKEMFLQVLDLDVDDPMANNGLGEISYLEGEFETAKCYFESALKGDSKYSVAYLGLAKALYKLNLITECKKLLVRGIEVASKKGDLMPANEMQSLLVKLAN